MAILAQHVNIFLAGTSQWIDDFVEAIGRDRVIEVARSGFTALER